LYTCIHLSRDFFWGWICFAHATAALSFSYSALRDFDRMVCAICLDFHRDERITGNSCS
jgi:hypothetical protein